MTLQRWDCQGFATRQLPLQLGDVAGDAPSLIESQHLGDSASRESAGRRHGKGLSVRVQYLEAAV
jgi:hypothetical protein